MLRLIQTQGYKYFTIQFCCRGLLSGIEFPKDKSKVIDYAEKNKKKVDEPEELINTIKEIPDRIYHNMVDIEKALGEIRLDRQ